MSISDTSLNEPFLSGGGETGALLRATDWNFHTLGNLSQWPQSLKTSVAIMLRSGYPMFIWWRKNELINLYNDAYIPIMGKKHPSLFAKTAHETWSEIWDVMTPLIERVFNGESIYETNLRLILHRNDFAEETYFNFSYSPIIGETDEVEGLFCACHEETHNVLERRRLQNLTTLSGKLSQAQTITDIAHLAMEKLAENPNDIPYAALYLLSDNGCTRLAASFGIPPEANATAFPQEFFYTDENTCPIREAIRSGEPVLFGGMKNVIPTLPHFFTEAPDQIYIQPIKDSRGRATAVLITGITPHCPFGQEYRSYKETIAGKIATSIRTVNTLRIEQEARQKTEDSRRRFHEMIMEAPMGIAVLRSSEFVVEVTNDTYLALVGRPRQTVEGHRLFDAIPELRGQAVESLLNEVLRSGESFHGNEFEAFLVREGRKESRYFNFVYKPMHEEDGSITGILVVAMDVTDMVKSKHTIQESESRFRSMVMHSPIPMTIFRGEEYVIEMANLQMLQNIWQKEEHEVIGKKALEVFPELMDQKYPELLKHVLSTGIPHSENEAEAYVGTQRFYLDFEYAPLFEADGTVSGIMITVNDVTERVESRQRLVESETYFRRMADGVPVMIWITRPDGTCSYVNKQWHEYTGQAFHESLGYGWLESIHPDDQGYVRDNFSVSLAKRQAFDTEFRLMNREGGYRWILSSGLPRFATDGQFEGYIGTVADIDDRKKAEEQLRESEERSRLAILAAELGTYEWEMGTGNIRGSERFMNIFGYKAEDKIQRADLIARIHPDDRPIHKAAHEEALRTGVLSYETRLIWADQSMHWVKIKGKVVHDHSQSPLKMLGTVMDITDIRRFEQALKTSESRLSEAQRIAGIGNWEYYYTDKSFYCSDEVYRILGTTPALFMPGFQNLFRIIHPQDIKKLNRTLSFTRKTGLPFNIDFRIITPEETIKHINSQGYVVLDAQQKIVKIIGTLQDITLRKRVEEELIEAKGISEKSLRYKDQFLANMSHEIRTPMNAIVGFTELLLKTHLQIEQRQYIDAIKVSGENLLVIINDILDFSKLEAGAIHFEQIPFRLSELVSTLTDLMLPKSVEKGIKLSVNIDPHISDHLVGDPTRLNQILLNLVGNAIKFTEQGEVKISAEPLWDEGSATELKFRVTDTGIGIESHMFEAIFDVFTQTASDTTRKYGGSGLGLAIVKQFVEKQNGQVGVESTLGEGSTFWFTLPFGKAAKEETAPKTDVTEEQIHQGTAGLRILLVEDNKLNQLLASKALSNWNCQVEVADNGLIALEKIAQKEFDLVLMDIQLPEMDGYEATRHIRKKLPAPKCHIPIIAVTAHAMQSEAKKCTEAGMNGYISKPFSPKMLYEGIMAVMKSSPKVEKIN